jgi:hypothetical protein
MARTITWPMVVVLLMGSVAMAQIGNIGPQTQAWDFQLGSTSALLSGQGSASNHQFVVSLNGQSASTSEGTHAFQGFGVLLGQCSVVNNIGAPISAVQSGSVNGDALNGMPLGQTQSFSAYGGPAGQYEGVEVTGTQDLVKEQNGTGDAEAFNIVGHGMVQCGGSTCTDMGQGSLILGAQHSKLVGETCASSGLVSTDFTAVVVQQQVANCNLVVCPETE